MAKVKEESALDAAKWEREELWKRREKILRNIITMEQRCEELRSKLVTLTDAERREFMELRRDIPLENEILAEVEAKGKERDSTIEQLTREKARSDANLMVEIAMDGFQDVLAAFADPVSVAGKWLGQANEAADRYSSCHPGLGGVNWKLQPKIEIVRMLLHNIENGKKL